MFRSSVKSAESYRLAAVWTPQRKLSSGGWCSLYAGGLQNIYGENDRKKSDESSNV